LIGTFSGIWAMSSQNPCKRPIESQIAPTLK